MRWEFLAVRTSDETDASMYPTVDDAHGLRPLGGESAPKTLVAKGVEIFEDSGSGQRKVAALRDVSLTVAITDQRVAVTCAKYDKGGGWWGLGGAGLAVAVVANGVSHARAAHRRKGKTLVGHVRHQWISQVGFMPHYGIVPGQVRLVVHVKEGTGTRKLSIDLILPRNVDARSVADAILRRATAHVLSTGAVADADERTKYEQLAAAGLGSLGPAAKGSFRLQSVPRYWFVTDSTVALKPAATPTDAAAHEAPVTAAPPIAAPPTAVPATAAAPTAVPAAPMNVAVATATSPARPTALPPPAGLGAGADR